MEAKGINEEVVCYLKKGEKGRVFIGYENIERPFDVLLLELNELCSSDYGSITEVIRFIREKPEFLKIRRVYKYCEELHKAYQGVEADAEALIERIQALYAEAWKRFEKNQISSDFDLAVNGIKDFVLSTISVWFKAYAIELAYKACQEKHDVLAYSHRKRGWSNPSYQLTDDFSIEIKTNFGYGSATYFYTRITYKDVEIVPFSEWVTYRFAHFHEIVRYSKRHVPDNEKWLEAMTFARDACNMTLIDEERFVEVYVVEECERMIGRLEKFLEEDEIVVLERHGANNVKIDKQGRALVMFRGEKVSGALDFISKIREFEKVVGIQEFISRIESCNTRLRPILENELVVLREIVRGIEAEKLLKRPGFESMKAQNEAYNEKKVLLRNDFRERGLGHIVLVEREFLEAFCSKHPEYEGFVLKFKVVSNEYNLLCQNLHRHVDLLGKVISYLKKIDEYFSIV